MGVLLSPQDFAGSIGAAPVPGGVRVGNRALAGADLLAMRAAQGIERTLMPHLARTSFAAFVGTGANAVSATGVAVPAVTGGTARAPSATSMATRAKRTGFVSAATAGTLASCYGTTGLVTLSNGTGLGGFFAVFKFVPADAAGVSGARMFVGLSSNTGAPTNVEPSGLVNQIGVAQLSGSPNLQLLYGGATAQAPIDLGAGFPASGSSADLYELILFSDPNDATKMGYRVERLNTGTVTEGTLGNSVPGTTLPAATMLMAMRLWRTNNATALPVGLDLVAATLTWDF
jgi:hypothetical protein